MLLKIQSWLLKPKVWSFVCFVSSVVGLLCYGLSAAFNQLFGEWTWWKILLYIGFCFIISLAILFAKAWERSTSTSNRIEAHMAFLFLMITSVYSFFFDKEVKGKPDAYSLVSYASFAIMSLGLSRLSHFGFEIDLLYFFSGVLTIQLMKIKLWLVIVGGSFSYSLIILRSNLGSPPRGGYHGLQHQDEVVIEIGSHSQSQESDTVNAVADEDLEQERCSDIMAHFMVCIEDLKKENWNVMDLIFKHVREYLKANLVDKNQNPVVWQLHRDDNLVADSLPLGIINDFCETTRLMVAAGLKDECLQLYTSFRREFLKVIISTFAMQMDGTTNNMGKIQSSIKALNVAEKILLPNEMRLVERVFEGFIPSEDMLHLYHSLLGRDVVRFRRSFGIFGDLLYFTYGDKEQESVVPGGRIHQITSDVLAYIDMIYGNWRGLDGTLFDLEVFNSQTVLVAPITDLLQSCLEANSKVYNNPTLGYVFIMNNWRLIEIGAKWRGLERVLCDDWLRRITVKFQQNLELYQRSSWNRIVDFLKLDINESKHNVLAELLKDKLCSFNEHFDEICNVQSTWFVFDEQLREQIIKSVENMLPAYGNFIERFHDIFGKHAYKYIKYGMFDIQERLNKLFLIRE